jgi:molybdopterin/thiamine biosynthesis adenylyltransferase
MSLEFTRQNNIFNPKDQKSKIHILGAGSTGSFIALTLAKLGFDNINIYDFDKIEAHNIPNQFYRTEDIGKHKTEAIKDIVKGFSELDLNAENIKINKDTDLGIELNSIVIFCLDNIKTRALVYDMIKDYPIFLIDTRMGGEGYAIYSFKLDDEDKKKVYEAQLKAPTSEAPCGEKSVIYTILSIASETSNIVKRIDKEETYPFILKRQMQGYRILYQ